MTRTDAMRLALDSIEKTAAAMRELLDSPEPAPPIVDDAAMTPHDVAAAERVSVSFVFRAIKREELRASKLGAKTWRVERADYETWRSARSNGPRRRS